MWLPALGAVLFLSVGLWWALTAPPKDPTETMGSPSGTAAPTAPPPGNAAPGHGGAPGGH